jgi:hypothetical protein
MSAGKKLVPLLLCTTFGCAELQGMDLEGLLEMPTASSDQTIASGLKEALRVGTERAVASLSKDGGYADVPALRLQLPESLQPAAKTLRKVGMGRPAAGPSVYLT